MENNLILKLQSSVDDATNLRVFLLKTDQEKNVSRCTARTVSIYASPLRRRKIRSTFDFGSLLSLSRSNCQSLSSLTQSPSNNNPTFDLVKPHSVLKYARNSSLTDSETSAESEEGDEYVKAIRKILKTTIRPPKSRDSTMALCSGVLSGEDLNKSDL